MANKDPFYSTLTSEQIEERLLEVPGKYEKPATGIPAADLSNSVQESLGKANTAVQDVSGKMDKSAVNVDGSMMKIKVGEKTYVLNGAQELIKPNAPTMTAAATYDLTIGSTKNITINNAYSAQGGKVHYTTDGTTPTSASASFSTATKSVALGVSDAVQSSQITVKAIVILNGESSDVASTTYTTRRKVSTPVFAYSANKYAASRVVSATCATSGASLLLSTDGGDYAAYSSQTISASVSAGKYKVQAKLVDWVDSDVASSAAVTLNAPKTYYGYFNGTSITESQLKGLTALEADGISTNTQYDVTAPASGYIWICQPNTLNQAKIYKDKDAPFPFGYESAVKVGSWNCYRCSNMIAAGSFGIYLKS